MSGKLRHDNKCENCGYIVDRAYCSECGQKNTYTRQPFLHLLAHFFEDLTHYDSGFWKTIKHLLFRPARLTKEYLQGRRLTYVPPVKLYIFISFVTFFLLSLSVDGNDFEFNSDSGTGIQVKTKAPEDDDGYTNGNLAFKSVKELEEYQSKASESEKLFIGEYWVAKATLKMLEKKVSSEDVKNKILYTLPKVLFIYMPIFAFWLWIFHGKKRWYFFDHAIFTLHYFSFLLLLITFTVILTWLLGLVIPDDDIVGGIMFIIGIIFHLYSFFYFFRSHRRMYGEKRWVSRLKSLALFLINFWAISFVIFAAMIYAILNIH